MSLMDKLKSLFGGGSSDAADPHAGHDHPAQDRMPEAPPPAASPAPPMPPVDPAGMSTSEPQPSEEEERRPE